MKTHLSSSLLSVAFLACLPVCDAEEKPASQAAVTYKSYDVEGLSLVLPSAPQGPQLLQTSPKLAEIIKRQAIHVAGDQNRSVTIFHVEQGTEYPVNIKFAADGALENMRKIPGTTGFTSETLKNYIFPGWKTSEIVVKLKQEGTPKEVRILTLGKANHLYQITIEGGAGPVAELTPRVFSSVKLPVVK